MARPTVGKKRPAAKPAGRRFGIAHRETLVAGLILLALVLAGLWLWRKQYDYRPSEFKVAVNIPTPPPRGEEVTGRPGFDIPAGTVDVTQPGTWGPDNLSDRINGKADFFTASGFRRLTCRRFAEHASQHDWVETCVYEMESPADAFSVYSRQRRNPDSLKINGAARGYVTENGLFLIAGNRYVEITRSDDSDAARKLALKFANGISDQDFGPADLDFLSVLPKSGMLPGTEQFHPKGAFGFDVLSSAVSASYGDPGSTIELFVSARESEASAAAAIDRMAESLKNVGARQVKGKFVPEEMFAFQMTGAFEVISQSGRFVVAAHQAEKLRPAVDTVRAATAEIESASSPGPDGGPKGNK